MTLTARGLVLVPLLLAFGGCSLFVRPVDDEPPPAEGGDPEEVRALGVAPIDSDALPEGLDSPYWARIRAGGPLRVGIGTDFPPFSVPVDPAALAAGRTTQPWAGFDVELAEHLSATLGVPLELKGVRSKDAAERLKAGELDLIIAGLTRTARRAGQVNFSAPYLTISQAALVERSLVEGSRGNDEERRRGTMESYYDLGSVPGIKIGVVEGTRPERQARENFPLARIIAYGSTEEASQGLIAGQVSAIVHDDPYIRVWGALHPGPSGRYKALLEPVTEEPICIAMRKGDLEFLAFLNVYVHEVRNDGTVQRLYRKHFVDAAWSELRRRGGEQ